MESTISVTARNRQGKEAVFALDGTVVQTTPKTKSEKKEAEIQEIITKIEDRNDKVEEIKKTYFQPSVNTLKNIIKMVTPVTPEQ